MVPVCRPLSAAQSSHVVCSFPSNRPPIRAAKPDGRRDEAISLNVSPPWFVTRFAERSRQVVGFKPRLLAPRGVAWQQVRPRWRRGGPDAWRRVGGLRQGRDGLAPNGVQRRAGGSNGVVE